MDNNETEVFNRGYMEGFRNEPPTQPNDALYMIGYDAGKQMIADMMVAAHSAAYYLEEQEQDRDYDESKVD